MFKKDGFFETANKVVAAVRKRMSKFNYNGPAGIDFYIFQDQTHSLHLKTFGEINPRTTMAHISNGLRKHISSNVESRWILKGAKDLKNSKFKSWSDLYEIAKKEHPLVIKKTKWNKGILLPTILILKTMLNPYLLLEMKLLIL